MVHRLEVRVRQQFNDPHAQGVLAQIRELGITSVSAVRSARLFFLTGELTDEQLHRIGAELLADPVTEEFRVGSSDAAGWAVIEVHLKHGVMDPVAASAESAIRDMGLAVEAVRTARRYELQGRLGDEQLTLIARRLLANDCIEDVYFQAHTPPETHPQAYELQLVEIPIRDLDDQALMELSKSRDLFLNLTEMRAIQAHYRQLGREPRDVETAACAFEHLLTEDAVQRVCTFLGHPSKCPHGRPIPPGDCCRIFRETEKGSKAAVRAPPAPECSRPRLGTGRREATRSSRT